MRKIALYAEAVENCANRRKSNALTRQNHTCGRRRGRRGRIPSPRATLAFATARGQAAQRGPHHSDVISRLFLRSSRRSLGSAQDRFAGGVSKERAARDHGRGRRPRRRDGRPDRRRPYRFQLGRLPRAGRRRSRRGRAGARALPHPRRRARGGGGGRRDELAALPGALRRRRRPPPRTHLAKLPHHHRPARGLTAGASRSPLPARPRNLRRTSPPRLRKPRTPPADPPPPHRASRARTPSPPRRVALRSHGRRHSQDVGDGASEHEAVAAARHEPVDLARVPTKKAPHPATRAPAARRYLCCRKRPLRRRRPRPPS